MAKPNLKSLSPMAFTKMTPTREEHINAASSQKLPTLDSYKANALAQVLHPEVQHLLVTDIIIHNADTKSYVLSPNVEKGTTALAWFSAGQYLSVSLNIGQHILTRPYSLSSNPSDVLKGNYMITVKKVRGGLASTYILDRWEIGTEVTASAPLGNFTYEPLRDAKTIVGIAGGSGITPFRSLAYAIADGLEDTSLILLYGSRTLADALFTKELQELAAKCPNFRLINVLSEEEAEGYEKGFITSDLIKKYAPADSYSIFLCGPQAMYEFADEQIKALSLKSKYIRHELFGEFFNLSKETDYTAPKTDTVTITVRQQGTEQSFTAGINTSILRSLEAQGIACPSHCRSGECGWCHSKLIEGEIYTPKALDGRREADSVFGYIHPCCSFPLSDIVIEVPPITLPISN